MQQQAEVFSASAGVAGLHGAAFGNIVWMPEGTDVLEFFASSYMPYTFACISAIRSVGYRHDRYKLASDNLMGPSFLDRARRHMSDVRQSCVTRDDA
jgi:capsular polysaccharide biosynthesis protein